MRFRAAENGHLAVALRALLLTAATHCALNEGTLPGPSMVQYECCEALGGAAVAQRGRADLGCICICRALTFK